MEVGEVFSSQPRTQLQSESWKELHDVSIVRFLNHDSRPAFIFDLRSSSEQQPVPTYPIYINPALCKLGALFDIIGGKIVDGCSAEQTHEASNFIAWAKDLDPGVVPGTAPFGGYLWQSITLDDRWRIIVAITRSVLPVPRIDGALDRLHSSDRLDSSIPSDRVRNDSDKCSREADRDISPTVSEEQGSRLLARDFFLRNSSACKAGATTAEKDWKCPTPTHGDEFNRDSPDYFHNAAQYDCDPRAAKRNAELLAKIAGFEKVAIYMVDIKGDILFCNDAWYNICNHPRDQINASTWTNIFEDDEIPRMVDVWRRAAIDQEAVRYEARLKQRWKPPTAYSADTVDFPTWISGWTYPDIAPTGETVGCCGVMTEITEQKWTEQLMEQRLTDAIDRASLMEQLSTRAKQVAESETRFRRLSDMMPIGVWMSDALGNVIYSNDAYHDIIPGSQDASKPEPWWEVVPQEHLARLQEFNRQLLEDHTSITFEVPLKKLDKSSGTISDEYRWVLISTYPELHKDGSVAYLTGCVTDITHLKIAEEIQEARASDALESKRQLEQFIDMTSHEMRNPLSAIVHSAEEILASLKEHELKTLGSQTLVDAIEAAETIIYCSDHSTRIVDDILLVSKLESGLLDITPTAVQPVRAIQQAWNMFSREMKAFDITQSFEIDDSLKSLKVDWVYLDMTRVLQVFVNLITNAIKFTRSETTREIKTCLKASLHRPTKHSQDDGIHYLEPQAELPCAKDESGALYLSITVTDTGCGLSEIEQGNLFQRFSQAGKRTHVKYGGTGLGLFISRKLCEMQNGQIGLRSRPQEGSVFSFYVVTQRALPPDIKPTESDSVKITPDTKSAADLESCVREQRNDSINDKILDATLPSRPSPRVSDMENGVEGTSSRCSSRNSPSIGVSSSRGDVDAALVSSRLSILLVEDNLINQKVVAKKLTKEGYIVPVANHGLEAIDHVKKSALWTGSSRTAEPISLILLDLEMPVMDGLSCIRYIRESEKRGEVRCHIPVIAVTANARQEQIKQALEAGMDDVVTKPFRMEKLTTVIARLTKEFPTTDFTNVENTT